MYTLRRCHAKLIMHSFWEKKYWLPKVDFCIIGAGIVGLSTGIYLKEKYPDKSVLVLERGNIPQGASTKNAGFACYGTAGEILDDLSQIQEKKIIETIKLRWAGLQLLQSLVPAKAIDYINCGGYELFYSAEEYEKCANSLSSVNKILKDATGITDTLKTIDSSHGNFYTRAIFNKYEGQLNPVKLVSALIRKAERLKILIRFGAELSGYHISKNNIKLYVSTKEFDSTCTTLIFATNAFTKKFLPDIDVAPSRNQVVVTSEIENLNLQGTYHVDKGYIYFRNIGNRLLLGGARNLDSETEKTEKLGENPLILEHLKKFMQQKLSIDPRLIDHQWSGIIATGESKLPIIIRHADNVYAAVRLGGMGVATGAAVARKLVFKHIDL